MAHTVVSISPPNFQTILFRIRGITPYGQHRFSTKVARQIEEEQEKGKTASKNRAKREAKNWQEDFDNALYRLPDNRWGMPSGAFRNAMIDACRLVGFEMTKAKMCVFTDAYGFDIEDHTALSLITKGEPHLHKMAVILPKAQTRDIHAIARWDEGWEAEVVVRVDADLFTIEDTANLLQRAGTQIGIGEGRPFGRQGKGIGWGLFTIIEREEVKG